MKEFKGIALSQMAPINPEVVWVKSTSTGIQLYFHIDGEWRSFSDVASTGAYSDLTGKPVIPTVPQISTDVISDKASDEKTVSPKAVYSIAYPEVLGYTVEETVIPAQEEGGESSTVEVIVLPSMLPNIKYSFGTLTEGTFTLNTTNIDSNIENIWHWTFDTNTESELSTFTMPNVKWTNGSAPSITSGKYYDIKVVLDNAVYYATYTVVSL